MNNYAQLILSKFCRLAIIPFLVVITIQNQAFAIQLRIIFNNNGTLGGSGVTKLVFDSAGNLYGGSGGGGTYGWGTIFKLTPPALGQASWTQTTLVNFNNTSSYTVAPSELVLDSAGNFYGTTNTGGTSNVGTIFKLTPPAVGQTAWGLTTLVNFDGTNGEYPIAGLVFDTMGNLYGIAHLGPVTTCCGSVFKLTPPVMGETAWTQTTIYQFDFATTGAYPYGTLVFDPAGNLYGNTSQGGMYGNGTVFKLTPVAGQTAWSPTVLFNFSSTTGSSLSSPVFDLAGNLYGVTSTLNGTGIIYKLTPPTTGQITWTETTLVNNTNSYRGLTIDPSGNIYGTTDNGGASGYGSFFRLTPPSSGQTNWTLTTLIDFDNWSTSILGPASGYVFDSAGNLYGGSSCCIYELILDKLVLQILNTNKSGGTVVSNVGGVACGAVCSSSIVSGTLVTLTAIPVSGYEFTGWGGACSGYGNSCTVMMNAAQTVTANFAPFKFRQPSWKRVIGSIIHGGG